MQYCPIAFKCSLLMLAVSMAGCSSAPPLSPDHIYAQSVSLAAYDQLIHPIDLTVVDPNSVPQMTVRADSLDEPDYLESHALRCIGPDEAASMNRANQALCGRRGGKYEVHAPQGVCATRSDSDHPLFVMLAFPRAQTCFDITMIEPRGSTASPEYVNELARHGFVTQVARQEQAKRASAYSQRLQEQLARKQQADEARLAAELPRLHEIGATACNFDGEITYMAYVEDFTDKRLKLRVSAAFATLARVPMPFQQQIIWSTPVQWHPC